MQSPGRVISFISFVVFTIKSTLGNTIGRLAVILLTVACFGFAALDVAFGVGWYPALQLIAFGIFGISTVSCAYSAGRADGHQDAWTVLTGDPQDGHDH